MEFPAQQSSASTGAMGHSRGAYDMRSHLTPRRMTMVMWDQAYLLRHRPGDSFGDWDRVLDETSERGYNTLRIDPMPQTIDLSDPNRELTWHNVNQTYMPWGWQEEITCPAGRWLIEFMQKAVQKGFWLTLSAWWFHNEQMPAGTIKPRDTMEGAELWAKMLRVLQREVGLDRVVYVDYANEMPYFFPEFMKQLNDLAAPGGSGMGPAAEYTPEQKQWLRNVMDLPLAALQREFPDVRFTHSIHGDPRWFSVGLQHMDCLDAHFYLDRDPRWTVRTEFRELCRDSAMFREATGFKNFSDRCMATHRVVGPMLRAKQRQVMSQFSQWAEAEGTPLTCSEAWASWFYVDHPDLDWGWLLEYSEQAIDDAIEFGFWGVTPNNYIGPHFELWKDVRFHRRLNDKFLSS